MVTLLSGIRLLCFLLEGFLCSLVLIFAGMNLEEHDLEGCLISKF
jgi:hypothetical protein